MIYDPIIQNRILIEGQKERIADEVLKPLSLIFPALKDLILSYNNKNLKDTLQGIKDLVYSNFEELDINIQKQLAELGFAEGRFEDKYYKEIVEEQTGIPAVAYLLPLLLIKEKIPKLDVQGNSYKKELNLIKARLAQDINKKVRFGLQNGQDYTTIFNNVKTSLNKTNNGMNNFIATSTQALMTDIAETYSKKNKKQSNKEIFVAVLDSATTNQCRRNNGKIFEIGEGAQTPLHYNCRSIRIKYYENIDDDNYTEFVNSVKKDEIPTMYKKGDGVKYSLETLEKKQNALLEKEKNNYTAS